MSTDRLEGALRETSGGIEYTLMNGFPTFKFSDTGTTATEQYLLRASDLLSFVEESNPLPFVSNGLVIIPTRRRMPGTNFLITKTIDAKPHTGSLPADPLGSHDSPPDGTYDAEMVVTINYETQKESSQNNENERNERDPVTFLERDVTLGGEFLSLGPQNTETGDSPLGDDPCPEDGEDSSGVWTHPTEPGEPLVLDLGADYTTIKKEPAETEATADPNLPAIKLIPTGELTYKWPLVISPPWARIFTYLGTVNNLVRNSSGEVHREIKEATARLFFNLEPETIVFQGISGTQRFLWNGATLAAQPWDLDYRFSVKRVYECGNVYGWNHVWVPKEQKWKKLYRRLPGGGREELYKQRNLLNLFLSGRVKDEEASS